MLASSPSTPTSPPPTSPPPSSHVSQLRVPELRALVTSLYPSPADRRIALGGSPVSRATKGVLLQAVASLRENVPPASAGGCASAPPSPLMQTVPTLPAKTDVGVLCAQLREMGICRRRAPLLRAQGGVDAYTGVAFSSVVDAAHVHVDHVVECQLFGAVLLRSPVVAPFLSRAAFTDEAAAGAWGAAAALAGGLRSGCGWGCAASTATGARSGPSPGPC